MTKPITSKAWHVWNWIFFAGLVALGGGLSLGFIDDQRWVRVKPFCVSIAVAAVLTGLRVLVSPKGWVAPLVFTALMLLALLCVGAVMLCADHGWAEKVDWSIPVLLIGYSQCSRWFQEPK